MATDEEKKQPPILFILIVVFTLFLLISIGINHFFQLPRYIPIPLFWRITAGIILLAFGFFILFNALRALTVNRALGEEIYKSKTESRLSQQEFMLIREIHCILEQLYCFLDGLSSFDLLFS